MKYKLLFLTISLTVMTGCTDNSSKSETDPEAVSFENLDSSNHKSESKNNLLDLQGTWSTVCIEDEDDSYIKSTLIFTKNKYETQLIEYIDKNCLISEDSMIISGTYNIGKSLKTSSGLDAYEVDLKTILEDGEKIDPDEYFITNDIYSVNNGKLYQGLFDDEELDNDEFKNYRPNSLNMNISYSHKKNKKLITNEISELEGAWNSNCLENLMSTYIFSNNKFTYFDALYTDDECKNIEEKDIDESGTFIILDSIKTHSGREAKKIELNTMISDGEQFYLKEFNIFQISGVKLYFGDSLNIDGDLDMEDIYYTKIQ